MKSAVIAAIVAALVSSGGTFAASNLISGKQIRNHSIETKKLTRRTVRQLHGLQGPAGPVGTFSTTDLTVVDSGRTTIAPGQTGSASAICTNGAKAISGGFSIIHGNDELVDAYASFPTVNMTSWTTLLTNGSQVAASVEAFAVCAS